MENLTHTGYIEVKRLRGNQRITKRSKGMNSCKWIAEHEQGGIVRSEILLSVTMDWNSWRAMISPMLK